MPDSDETAEIKKGGRGQRYGRRELATMMDREIRRSLGGPESDIAQQRIRNMQYYRADAVGELAAPAVPDRSSIVSTDVADTVEWMLPQLIRAFAGSKEAIELKPRSMAFAHQAKMASEYMRHIFWHRCDGYQVLRTWFRDAFIGKVGFVKVDWDSTPEDIEESYRGLLPEQAERILNDPNVEPLEQDERAELIVMQHGMPAVPVTVYDLKIKRTKSAGRCRVLPVPAEEMRVHRAARYGEEPLFIAQVHWRTRGELEAEGYDLTGVASGADEWSAEEMERQQLQTRLGIYQGDEGEFERYRVAECYPLLDQDNDGVPERRRVLLIGHTVFEDEQVNDHPFVEFCPVPLPHTYFGTCPADQAIEPQRLGTSLMRALLDNTYLTVNQRTFGLEGQVNLDDLTSNRPGGHVRVKNMNALAPLAQPQLDQAAWRMVEWSEGWREQRTGHTRYSKGLKADALSPQTATGAALISERDDMRAELIAREAAHSVRKMLQKLLRCVTSYQDVGDVVELFGQWVQIDPREWHEGFDISVEVGLGAGNKDRKAATMQSVLGIQMPLAQAGQVPPQAVIAAARAYCEAAGLTDAEAYFPNPAPPAPPQPPLPLLIEQVKGQTAEKLKQVDAQVALQQKQAELQVQAQNDARDSQRARVEAQLRAELEAQKAAHAEQIAAMQEANKKAIAELQSQTQILIAQMSHEHSSGEAEKGRAALQSDVDGMARMEDAIGQLVTLIKSPRRLVRDQNGRALGVEVVTDQTQARHINGARH